MARSAHNEPVPFDDNETADSFRRHHEGLACVVLAAMGVKEELIHPEIDAIREALEYLREGAPGKAIEILEAALKRGQP